MPIVQVPLVPLASPQVEQNVDQESVSVQYTKLNNAYVNDLGYIARRPGVAALVDLGTDDVVDGLYWWQEQDTLIAVSGGEVFSVDAAGTATSLGTGMETGTRPTFATATPSGDQTLVLANGGRPYKISGDPLTLAEITDANAPANCTHVAFLDQYILANNANTQAVSHSVVATVDDWDATGIFSAEIRTDNVTGVFSAWEELLVLGTDSLEIFYNDGVTPFVPRQGATIERGTISPYTVKYVDNTWFFLDSTRRVVRLAGRNPQVISGPFDKTFQELDNVEDATGDIIEISGKNFYVLSFPSENRTFVYDYKLGYWGEWTEWNEDTSVSNRFIGNCHAYSKVRNTHYVGSKTSGQIYTLSVDNYDDAGDEIRTEIQTGFIDHGTLARKRNNLLRIRVKRGVAAPSNTAGIISLKYRDDSGDQFSNERQIDLGLVGQRDFHVDLRRMGMYRARQYNMVLTDATAMLFGSVEEDVEVMLR
jgi:hypothetical protein